MAGGRPGLYASPEELQKAIDEYFATTPVKTITGLALHLGFESRQSFYDYEKNEKFTYAIKRARARVELNYETLLQRSEGQVTGAIFALKNMGWKDKTEVETSGTVTQLLKMVDDDRDDPIN